MISQKVSVCVIDDAIPVTGDACEWIDGNSIIDANSLRYLQKSEINWSQENHLKKLFQELTSDTNSWNINAFLHPNIFISHIENGYPTPDIIIFDWNYVIRSFKSEELLLRILKLCSAFVFVYTGGEEVEPIKEKIDGDAFKPFKNRVQIIGKDEVNSEDILIEKVKELEQDNFAFKFGKLIRKESLIAVEDILITLGQLKLDEVYKYIETSAESNRDLIEIIGERFKNCLCTIDLQGLPKVENTNQSSSDEMALAEKLWAHRLYFPKDKEKIVCKGDLIYKASEGTSVIYMVISSDCDLTKFWNKNFGYINLIPLYAIKKDNKVIEKILKKRNKNNILNGCKPKSLIDGIKDFPDGPFMLPFVDIQGESIDYIGMPKEILSTEIPVPQDIIGSPNLINNISRSLKYDDWKDYKPIVRVSEPFLSPLVEHILKSIAGYGVPDYQSKIRDEINKRIKDSLN
jgi:hypothetical protein